MNTIKAYKLELIGSIAGAAAGWFYWLMIGCTDGSCAIVSDPFYSTLYGMVMGALVFSLFKPSKKIKEDKSYDQ